jgi:hypothetical protein
MVAMLDSKGKSFFVTENTSVNAGATAIGLPVIAPCNEEAQINYSKFDLDDKRYTWFVCPHLTGSDRVYEYYMSSGLIIIVFGKCFCEDCLDMILSNSDLSELVKSSRPMTDRLFQENFVHPLIDSNSNFTNKFMYLEEDQDSRKTWICCAHLSTKAKLNEIYSNCGQIYIFENHIICQDCYNMIPANSLIDILYTGEAMTNVLFQEIIVNSFYLMNHEMLNSIKHHGWYETDIGNQ